MSPSLNARRSAGVDHLLSLDEANAVDPSRQFAAHSDSVPRPHGDLDSLQRAARIARARAASRSFSIRSSIRFTSASPPRSPATSNCARREPEAEIMMGTGNLTELTDADSAGVTAAMLGICSELDIRHLLTVQVSPHTRRTLQEHDAARRLMFAARADRALPKGYSDALLQIHDTQTLCCDAGRDRRACARTARCEFPHRCRRRTACTSTPKDSTMSQPTRWRSSRILPSNMTAPTPFTLARN